MDIKTLLASNPLLFNEAWSSMKGWYQEANNYDPLPAQITIEQITADRVDLYPPQGRTYRCHWNLLRWINQYQRRWIYSVM